MTGFFCLEDNTERSESSPGRSLGWMVWWYAGMVVGFVACCLCCGGCCLEEENSTKHSVGRPNYIEIRKKSTKVKIECAAIISKIRSVYVMVTPNSGKIQKNE